MIINDDRTENKNEKASKIIKLLLEYGRKIDEEKEKARSDDSRRS